MPITISIVLPPTSLGLPPAKAREARAYDFQNALNATARINADWVMREWDAGRHPKCCAKCNGTRYQPDTLLSDKIEILTSPLLFSKGVGSCGSIAACHTGHKIAEAIAGTLDKQKYGNLPPMSYDEACERFIVQLADGPDPKKPMLLHAVCNDNGLIIDATEGMKR